MGNKGGQASIFIIVAVFLLAAIVLLSLLQDKDDPDLNVIECEVDSDCRPAKCCNAETCVSEEYYPDCTDVNCSTGCDSQRGGDFFLGCGLTTRGVCECIDQKCLPNLP